MIDEVPLFNSLSEKEIQAIEALLGGPQKHTLNGHATDIERSLLKKTGTRNLEELVSLLHREIIGSTVSDDVKQKSVDHILKDPRFERFQVFAEQGVRILDNSTQQYLYVNEATTSIMGYTPEEILKGGLTFGHRKTHPWDLLQLALLSVKALKLWRKLPEEDKLNARFSFDIRIRHKDGKYRRILQHAYTLSLTDEGKPGLLMMVSNDITSHKTSTKIQYVFGVHRPTHFDVLWSGETGPHGNPLTERETQVVYLIAQGQTENEISATLKISAHTVKTHKKNILSKSNCRNTAELIRVAMMEGWI